MLHFSKRVLLCLYIILTFSLYSQNLFWAEKEVLSDGISFFSTFKSSDEYIYSVWQEVNYFPGNYGGLSSLKIKKSRDGYTWENIPHNIKPVEFYGQTPIQNYSIDCNREGELILAYAHGEAGSYNNIDIYQINSDFNNLEYKNTIKYDKAVLQPTIYYRGSGEDLNLILFVSSLKEFISDNNSSTQLETGALSIFSTTSKDGINWSDTTEFINSTSDQSFLPVYTFYNNKEYVIYQSVLTSSNQSNNFQLYIKSKNINDEDWSQDLLLTNFDEFVTGSGSQNYKEFDNQRVSFTLRNGQLGITWERSFGYEASKIYYGNLIEVNNTIELVNRERITNGSRSCSRPTGFEFNNEFMLMWFDNQLGSNDIVMATLDKQSGLWIEKIISDDREYYSVFGQFLQFKNSLRIYWEDQTINRDDVTTTRARILALNPDRDVDSPFIKSNYKKRDNKNLIKLSWNRPKDSSGIKSFHYTWSNNEGEIVYEKSVLSTILVSDYLEAINDGEYIFTLVAEDNAGNISNKRIFNYYYDKTPPNKVDFPELKTDEKGFLLSNSESIEWSSLDDDVEGFSYKLSYLGENYAPGDFNINTISLSSVFSNMISVSFSNIDNGYYALVVRAIDSAGNIGNPEAVIFKVNKYIPITYISYINYSQNDTGELVTTINGRGFKDGGDVSVVILDMDGIEPYDYYFENDPNVFRVATDRRIEGPNLDEIEGGTYRVGIIHPLRGLFFSKPIIKVESTGTVKFGDFTVGYEEVWENVVNDKIVITFEFLIFIIILISSIFITFFTTIRLISTIKESKRMYHDAKALAKGTLFLNEKDILRIRNMKKQGFGLRLKFTILIITLIIGVIALISLPLASFMIETQKKNLTEGLRQRTEILLNSISTGAKDYIQIKDVLALDNLIKTTDAMDDVLWASIVGVSETDSKITDALWAYTDTKKVGYYIPLPNEISISDYNEYLSDDLSSNLEIFNRVYTFSNRYILNSDISLEDDLAIRKVLTDSGFSRDIVLGQTRYKDEVYNEITELISNIEEKGNLELSDKKDELSRIQAERSKATGARAQELSDIINLLESQINQALKIMSSGTGQLPNVDYQEIENIDSILFYKPILYNEVGVSSFYKGMVRLRVSTESINMEIANSIRNLTIRVGITAVFAILIGIVGALILATFMINPIKRLVAGVQVIRDTEDKSELKSHEIIVNSKDELYTLASTVNQMTEGLVKAAAMSKDVTMGKEIQKMFIPLELNPAGEGKLTTGEFDNNEISVFGYYEGAKGVSGDYFDYRQIDDDHFAMIKCDIAGKGVPASLIMVEVATIFLAYFRNWNKKTQGYNIDELVYSMNDLLEERGFKGRFAAFIVVILNTKTGKCHMCNAGDNLVHIYRSREHKMETKVLHEVPAAGIFSSDMLQMQGGYKVETTTLYKDDILFLFTDGVEESKHLFRDEKYNEIICQHPGLKEGELHDTHAFNEEFEELGVPRINEILHSVIHKTRYSLKKYHYPEPEALFEFDFTNLVGDVKEAVLGLICVEKIFRLNPDPSATNEDVIKIDKVVNNFLLKHFDQYSDYFKFKVDKGKDQQHVFFSNLKEDDQYDDLTILAIKKK